MARTVTRAQLRTQARQRADMENSVFVSDAELNSMIDASAAELYELLVGLYEDYYFSSHSVSTDGVNDYVALPTNFFKMLGVDEVISATRSVSVKPFNLQERNQYAKLGSSIRNLTLLYVPCQTKMTSDASTLDGVNGWEEYVIVDCARKMLEKEESDPSAQIAAKAALIERITKGAPNRDAGQPERIRDAKEMRLFGATPSLRYRIAGDRLYLCESHETDEMGEM